MRAITRHNASTDKQTDCKIVLAYQGEKIVWPANTDKVGILALVWQLNAAAISCHILQSNLTCAVCVHRPKTFAINKNVMFCTNHYKQLFATKGNYDEGFGRDQHKKRWKSEPNLADGEDTQQ